MPHSAPPRLAPPRSDREPHERPTWAWCAGGRRRAPSTPGDSVPRPAPSPQSTPKAKGSRGGTGRTTYPEDNPKPSPWNAARATPPSAAQCRSVLRDVTAHLSGAGGTTLLLLALLALPAGACLTRSPTNAHCLRLPPAPPAPPPRRPGQCLALSLPGPGRPGPSPRSPARFNGGGRTRRGAAASSWPVACLGLPYWVGVPATGGPDGGRKGECAAGKAAFRIRAGGRAGRPPVPKVIFP